MNINIDLDTSPMHPGESRNLTLWAEQSLSISIKCFLYDPPPPRFRECEACGEFSIQGGVPFSLFASPDLFSESRGELHIRVSDDRGESLQFILDVIP